MEKLHECDESLKESVSQIQEQLKEIKSYSSPFFDVKGAGKFLSLSIRRIYSLISDGDIAYYKNRANRIRFSKKQLEDFESYREFGVKDNHQ